MIDFYFERNRGFYFSIMIILLIGILSINTGMSYAEELDSSAYVVDYVLVDYTHLGENILVQLTIEDFNKIYESGNKYFEILSEGQRYIKMSSVVSSIGEKDPSKFKYATHISVAVLQASEGISSSEALKIVKGTPHDDLKAIVYTIRLDNKGNPIFENAYDKYLKEQEDKMIELKEGKNEIPVGQKRLFVYVDRMMNIREVTYDNDMILLSAPTEIIGNKKLSNEDINKIKNRIIVQNKLTLKSLGNKTEKIINLPGNILPTSTSVLKVDKKLLGENLSEYSKENMNIYFEKYNEKYKLRILNIIENQQDVRIQVLIPMSLFGEDMNDTNKYHFRKEEYIEEKVLKEGKNEVPVGQKILYVYADKNMKITEVTYDNDVILSSLPIEIIGNGSLNYKDIDKIKNRVKLQSRLTLSSLGKDIDNKIINVPENMMPTSTSVLMINKSELRELLPNYNKDNMSIYFERKNEEHELKIWNISDTNAEIVGIRTLIPLSISDKELDNVNQYHFRLKEQSIKPPVEEGKISLKNGKNIIKFINNKKEKETLLVGVDYDELSYIVENTTSKNASTDKSIFDGRVITNEQNIPYDENSKIEMLKQIEKQIKYVEENIYDSLDEFKIGSLELYMKNSDNTEKINPNIMNRGSFKSDIDFSMVEMVGNVELVKEGNAGIKYKDTKIVEVKKGVYKLEMYFDTLNQEKYSNQLRLVVYVDQN